MVERLKWWWSRLNQTPLRRWIFSKILSFLIPYTGTIRPVIEDVKAGYARVRLRDGLRVRNHLKSIHALALANLGELTTGLALHFAMSNRQRAILTRLEVEYLRKARGVVYAQAQIEPQTITTGLIVVKASIRDDTAAVVATVCAHWLVDER